MRLELLQKDQIFSQSFCSLPRRANHKAGTYLEAEPPELGEGEAIRAAIPADPNVKNYTYTVVDGQVYYRENSLMVRPDLSAAAEARVRGMVSLRDCVQELIALQMETMILR